MPKAKSVPSGDPSPEWRNHEVAKLLANIDDEKELPRAIIDALFTLTPADMGYVQVGDLQSKQNLYFHPAHYRFPDAYTGELVVLDPLYNATKDGWRGVLSLQKTMPPGFEETAYYQEFYASEAEDMGMIFATGVTVELANGTTYANCLQTIDWTPLEPGAVEFKFYAPGVGLIIEEHILLDDVTELTQSSE